jgi:UPF0716 family protein affecting phage T7 exclusion
MITWLLGVAAGLAWKLPLVFLGIVFGLLLILSLLFRLSWQETYVKRMAGQERKQQIALGLMTLLSMLAGSFWSTGFLHSLRLLGVFENVKCCWIYLGAF